MYNKRSGDYDEIPIGMKRYINNYGCHFNKALCDEAVSRMYSIVNGRKQKITPYTKQMVQDLITRYNIVIERDKLYDSVYVANMCKADFLGSSIPNEEYLIKYVKDVIDDVDAEEGYVFNRFYADCMFMNNPIDWEEVL